MTMVHLLQQKLRSIVRYKNGHLFPNTNTNMRGGECVNTNSQNANSLYFITSVMNVKYASKASFREARIFKRALLLASDSLLERIEGFMRPNGTCMCCEFN